MFNSKNISPRIPAATIIRLLAVHNNMIFLFISFLFNFIFFLILFTIILHNAPKAVLV